MGNFYEPSHVGGDMRSDMGRCQEAKGCCWARRNPGRGRKAWEGARHKAPGTLSSQKQISRAGERMGAEPHHSGAWAALIPKPASGRGLEDGDSTEIKGVFQGWGQGHLVYWLTSNIWHNIWLMSVEWLKGKEGRKQVLAANPVINLYNSFGHINWAFTKCQHCSKYLTPRITLRRKRYNPHLTVEQILRIAK